MKKTKIYIAGLAALAAASMIGGTWAVWTQQLLAKNEYRTAKYSTFLQEKWEEPHQWQPGITELKEVDVVNESTIPVIIKVTMNQEWERTERIKLNVLEDGRLVEKYIEPGKLPTHTTFINEQGQEEFAAILNLNSDYVVIMADNRHPDPSMRLNIPDENVVQSLDDPKVRNKWLLASEVPDEKGNFTFYYMGMLEPDSRTPLLMTGVTLNPLLEATVSGSETFYVEDPEAEDGYRKVKVDVQNSKYGYDGCHFTLNINMQSIQATANAIRDLLLSDRDPWTSGFEAGPQQLPFLKSEERILNYIAGYIADEGTYDVSNDDPIKTLQFEEVNGIMTYTPYLTSEDQIEQGNWFMKFVNMAPGCTYKDKLNIENLSYRTYSLYMKISPREDLDEIQNELLKKIAMKVSYRGKVIYDGDVTGYHYASSGDIDMQGLVPLGIYYHNRKEEICVELTLDKDLGLNDDGTYKYADVLTKVDWEFMVQEVYPGDGDDDDDNPGGRTPTTTVTVPDEPVPLDGLTTIGDDGVPLTILPDPEVPLAFMVPTTGDDFPVVPLAVTAIVSLLLMAGFGILAFGKKKKTE